MIGTEALLREVPQHQWHRLRLQQLLPAQLGLLRAAGGGGFTSPS